MRLRCTPEIESAITAAIFEAMEQVYTGDDRGNPFAWLTEIDCPVLRCDDRTILADL